MIFFLIFILQIFHSLKPLSPQIPFHRPKDEYDTIMRERNVSSEFGVVKNGEEYLRLNISIIDLEVNTRQRVKPEYFFQFLIFLIIAYNSEPYKFSKHK